MKLAIMQPYFLPYVGYFQLMAAVDLFIVYDNIKYMSVWRAGYVRQCVGMDRRVVSSLSRK